MNTETSTPEAELTPPSAPPAVEPSLRSSRRRQTFRDILEAPVERLVVEARVEPRRRRLLGVDVSEFGSAPAEAVVTTLYREILGREPDEPGLIAWSNHLTEGTPIDELARGLASSDEARNASPEQQVRAQRLLHRIGLFRTLEDLGAYSAHAYSGGRPGLCADQVFVAALYEVALRRQPAPAELDAEAAKLEHGVSREWMLRAFASRREVKCRLIGARGRTPSSVLRYLVHRVGYLRTFRDMVNAAESRRIAALTRAFADHAEIPDQHDGRTV
ncbi:DUF4214 domain-containing protein [Xylanimonas allomyrinae]|uniref:DUF4214 domain-containing protein n=1 Tax=Xylanimonas allomyrinae TaxID=2509459 RepID=A0A4P6ELY3_9MICO|nr:DUF4214 domain-containing protein [Xylanimonas allomyrinae]QAY63385.1 DUF4214 domain-containing protein [Xylanimonas allomyrinae]